MPSLFPVRPRRLLTLAAASLAVVALLLDGVSARPASPAPEPQARQTPAVPWVMKGDTAIIYFAVRSDYVPAFEAGMAALKVALETSPKAERQKQRAGWRVFRQVEPWAAGAVVYMFLLDPVVPGADYSVASILAENPPTDPSIRPAYVLSLLGGQTALDLVRTMDFGDGIDLDTLPPEPVRFEGPLPATVPVAGSEPRVFAGDLGVLIMKVDPEYRPGFDAVLQRLEPALAASLDPQRKRQAVGWRYYTSVPNPADTAPAPRRKDTDPVVPETVVFIIDPPVAGQDYSVSRIVSDAFPAESAALFKDYRAAFVGGATLLTYTLLEDFRR